MAFAGQALSQGRGQSLGHFSGSNQALRKCGSSSSFTLTIKSGFPPFPLIISKALSTPNSAAVTTAGSADKSMQSTPARVYNRHKFRIKGKSWFEAPLMYLTHRPPSSDAKYPEEVGRGPLLKPKVPRSTTLSTKRYTHRLCIAQHPNVLVFSNVSGLSPTGESEKFNSGHREPDKVPAPLE